MTRDEERAVPRARDRLDRAHDRPAHQGLDRPLLPERQHPRAPGRGRRLPLRLGRAATTSSPTIVQSQGKPFLVVPYSKIYNDVKYLIAADATRRPNHFFENLKLALDYMLGEADEGYGGAHDDGRPARPLERAGEPRRAVRDFIEYVLEKDGACFMRRARHREVLARAPSAGAQPSSETAGPGAGAWRSSRGAARASAARSPMLFAAEGATVVIADRTEAIVEGGEPTQSRSPQAAARRPSCAPISASAADVAGVSRRPVDALRAARHPRQQRRHVRRASRCSRRARRSGSGCSR